MVALAVASDDRELAIVAAASRLRAVAGSSPGSVEPDCVLFDIAGALVRHATRAAELERWVGQVGRAFATAGGAGPTVSRGRGTGGSPILTFGDTGHATKIAVIVPGLGSSTADGARRAHDDARRLYESARAIDPDVAVVSWIDYDPPGVPRALLDDEARHAGPALARFVEDLGRHGRGAVSVIGHSYGSLVAAEALRHGMTADDVVFIGSPGVGSDRLADLHAAGAHVYTERALLDPVALSEAFGRDPADPRFGATRLATGGVSGHSSYFAPGSTALANLAAVATQRDDLLVVQHPTRMERVVDRIDDVWENGVEAPIDSVQQAVPQVVDGLVPFEALDTLLPDGPWDGPLRAGEALRDAAAEEANRAVDVVQRVASPDGVRDVATDAWHWMVG